MFEGGSPATISPDGATAATNAYDGQLALWNVTRPRHPARLARLAVGSGALWGQAFTPDGHALTVVIARPETSPGTAARDTVFTWQVTGPDALRGLTTSFRDVSDAQPTLTAGGRVVADGSATGGEVHLWTLP